MDWEGRPENSSSLNQAHFDSNAITDAHSKIEIQDSHLSDGEPHRQENPLDAEMGNNVFSEIEAYGNSSEASSSLKYTVVINGIDSNSLYQDLREVLNDSRLGWDFDVIAKNMNGGQLILSDLNPAIATEVVRRIKGFQLDISWSQNVYQD